jgi:hypothetical protein
VNRSRRRVAPVLATGIAALVFGGAAGLTRMGADLPLVSTRLVEQHGALLVLGFLGTLIVLERAVALGRRWAFASPILCAVGAVALMVGLPLTLAAALVSAGMMVLVLIFVAVMRIQRSLPTAVLTASSVFAVSGALLWTAGVSIRTVVPWLVGFLVFAIVGERLDLARFATGNARVAPFVGSLLIAGVGIAVSPLGTAVAGWLIGTGLLVLVVWLARHDVARRTVHGRGVARFSALGLLFGYVSLTLAALAILYDGDVDTGRFADIAIHGVFVGFAMSMVMAHAPIIGPSVLRIPLRFSPLAYLPLFVLQFSLALRYAGDVASDHALVLAGGIGNAVALLGFVLGMMATVVWSVRAGGESRSAAGRGPLHGADRRRRPGQAGLR